MITTPEGINMWRVLSAVSQLGLELSTGTNFYGRTSVYTGIQRNMVDGLPVRATKRNKCLALATILGHMDASTLAGPVCTRAARVLADVMAEEGWLMS
jgi:hypothetical protein